MIEHLKRETFYMWKHVAKSRKAKSCCLCGITMPVGSAQRGMNFYGEDGEYPTYWVCGKCEKEHADLIAEITK